MESVVISLGGSIVIPDEVDHHYLNDFKNVIEKYRDTINFVIIVGGGARARRYQQAARQANPSITDEELDWEGIRATWENAQIVRDAFGTLAHPVIVKEYEQPIEFAKVLVGGGWKPGHSTDYDAVKCAQLYDATKIINVSSADRLYTKDPNVHEDAKALHNGTWKDLQRIVGDTWTPGAHVPFDPKAAKLGEQIHARLYLIGKDLHNLENVLAGREFDGTLIL